MALFHLHLVVDDDLGPALWVREQVEPRRSRAAADLRGVIEASPEPIAEVLSRLPEQLRHRVRLRGTGGAADRRLPAAALPPAELAALVGSAGSLLHGRFGAKTLDRLGELLEQGTPAKLSDQIAAMPDLLAATVLDLEARRHVRQRQLQPVPLEHAGRVSMRWRGLQRDRPAILDHLIDAHARAAFAAHRRAAAPELLEAAEREDRRGVIASLAEGTEAALDLPGRRRLGAAVERYLGSGRAVALTTTEDALVVRLHEPAEGTAIWRLETCLRHRDGTLSPAAQLRAGGALSAEGAVEAAGAILQHSPVVRGAQMVAGGTEWTLNTREAGAFLAQDTALLEQAGVTVLLPREWTRQRTTVRAQEVEEAPRSARSGGVGVDAMVHFRWQLAVGDTELTAEEIAEIRSAQSELVQLRGQWIRLDATTLRAAERFLDSFALRSGERGAGAQREIERRKQAAAARRAAAARGGADAAGADGADGGVDAGHDDVEDVPGELRADATWAQFFSALLSSDAEQLGISAEMMEAGGTRGIARLLPGGAGPRELPSPSTLQATLRPYQLQGLNWMWALHEAGMGGILADDMGLGKTMQVLALLCREREGDHQGGGAPVGPTLLVSPMSVVGSWQREATAFAPHLRVHVHHGPGRTRGPLGPIAARSDLVITTYSLLARDLEQLGAVPWHRVVFDEAQYLKTPDTQVTRAARQLAAGHRLALTGTPVENRLGDLHSLMEAVNPSLLGSAESFHSRIAQPIEADGDEQALSRLRLATSPFILRRAKTDRSIIPDLPQKQELTRVVPLTVEQAGLYEALVAELMAQMKQLPAGEENEQKAAQLRRSLVVSTITRLKQVCNHPAHYLGDGSELVRDGEHRSGKLELVDDLLETALADGEKVLLFTQFTTFGHMLVPYWAQKFGLEVPFLHGGIAKSERDRMVADFQERREEGGLMLLSLRAGGTGLTLTAANHVVHLDRWWNPAVENQATDRAFRIGQRKDVTVHKLVSMGTVEERIDSVLQEKQELASLTVSPGEDWLADLDDSSVLDLLSLDPRAMPGDGEGR